jgi:hypothetical protein
MSLIACENCKALKRPHVVCFSCGYYNGRKVMDLVSKVEKKQKKAKAKQAEK